jgi:ABC-2 type transport system ATP-binding protein
MDILTVKNLTKRFGKFTAVNNISFSLKEGEILGLLGPNGAGKTTTIQMLLGITTPDAGEINYFENDFFNNRQSCLEKINYTSAFNELQGRETVMENLVVSSLLYQIKNYQKKIFELVDYFGVRNLIDRRYKFLSSGEMSRINLIKSLLNDPKILLMDEPTASLDPDIADKTLEIIENLKKDRNLSILYTSHNMKEVDRICDRIIFLNHGEIFAEDTPSGLTKKMEAISLEEAFIQIVRKKQHVDQKN